MKTLITNVEKKLQELFTENKIKKLSQTRGIGEHRFTIQNTGTASFYVTTVLGDNAIDGIEIIPNKAIIEIKSFSIENIKFISGSETGVEMRAITH